MEKKEIQVRNTPPFKISKKLGKHFQIINLQKQFGFLPETIIIERITSRNNVIIVRAVLTDEEIKKEEKARKKVIEKKEVKKDGKK